MIIYRERPPPGANYEYGFIMDWEGKGQGLLEYSDLAERNHNLFGLFMHSTDIS
jgi:hypothetical protein